MIEIIVKNAILIDKFRHTTYAKSTIDPILSKKVNAP